MYSFHETKWNDMHVCLAFKLVLLFLSIQKGICFYLGVLLLKEVVTMRRTQNLHEDQHTVFKVTVF
jgi:hypothetical protein